MEIIKLEFSAYNSMIDLGSTNVVMTLDETGKKYHVGDSENQPSLPKRVLAAFNENAINNILSKDEIPNESGMAVLDGYSYKVTISRGDVKKEYHADDGNIETYPLLRFLASWCKRQKNNI